MIILMNKNTRNFFVSLLTATAISSSAFAYNEYAGDSYSSEPVEVSVHEVADFESAGAVFNSEAVSDEELSDMRGGYLLAGGLKIDFAINSQTLVDGVLQNEVGFSTKDLSPDVPSSTIISIGENNVISKESIVGQDVGSVLTIIQNAVDSKLIQKFTTVDIEATNYRAIMANNIASELNTAF